MKDQSTFGVLLRRYRQAAGISQETLAAQAGLSTRAISDLERGINRIPRSDTLDLLTSTLPLTSHQQNLLRASARPGSAAAASPVSSSHGLPLSPTVLIGRERELTRALALIQRSHVRLLTITGPGGVGKSRLALQLAQELFEDFPDGASFVALTTIRDAALVPEVLGQALGLREQLDTPMVEQVRAYLQHKQFLLVLDNFEHLLEAVPFVADLLANCSGLHLLVTSRTPLHLRTEQRFPLAPLALDDAVTLFHERAQAVRPGGTYEEATVAAVCERLDRLPLAIELAAMQVRMLSMSDLFERLTHRLTFLRGGATDLPMRQQTMRDAIAWSYELLTASQQRCFRALGVFVGDWTLEAAEAVGFTEGETAPDETILTLAALVDASLLQVKIPTEGATRFSMLELIREYALDRLHMAGEEEQCRWRHAAYYAYRGELVAPFGPGESQLVLDFPNARSALQWAEERQEATLGLRLARAFGEMWFSHGYMREAEEWFERMLALDWHAGAPEALLVLRAEVLYTYGETLINFGKLERAEVLVTEALKHAQQSGDQICMSIALGILGLVAKVQGKLDEAAAWFTESDAYTRLTEHLSINGIAMRNRIELAWIQGDLALATMLAEEGRLQAQSAGITFVVAGNTSMLGHLAHQQGNYALAKTRYQEALALYRMFGSPTYTSWCLEGLAATLCTEGRFDAAIRLCAAAAAVREQAQTPLPPAEREAFLQTVATAKAALGERTLAEEWNAGAAFTREQAIDYALSLDAQV